MVVDKIKPLCLPDEVAFALCVSFVDEESSLVESHTICSDKITILIPENHVLVSVYLESNFINPVNHENDL